MLLVAFCSFLFLEQRHCIVIVIFVVVIVIFDVVIVIIVVIKVDVCGCL